MCATEVSVFWLVFWVLSFDGCTPLLGASLQVFHNHLLLLSHGSEGMVAWIFALKVLLLFSAWLVAYSSVMSFLVVFSTDFAEWSLGLVKQLALLRGHIRVNPFSSLQRRKGFHNRLSAGRHWKTIWLLLSNILPSLIYSNIRLYHFTCVAMAEWSLGLEGS